MWARIWDVLVAGADLACRGGCGPQERSDAGKRAAAISKKPFPTHAIRICHRIDERVHLYSRLAIRCQTHDFPFIAVRLKPQIASELAVKQSQGIGKGNRQQVMQSP